MDQSAGDTHWQRQLSGMRNASARQRRLRKEPTVRRLARVLVAGAAIGDVCVHVAALVVNRYQPLEVYVAGLIIWSILWVLAIRRPTGIAELLLLFRSTAWVIVIPIAGFEFLGFLAAIITATLLCVARIIDPDHSWQQTFRRLERIRGAELSDQGLHAEGVASQRG